jgi:hypothetical protein
VYRGSCAATTATVTHLRPNARFWNPMLSQCRLRLV